MNTAVFKSDIGGEKDFMKRTTKDKKGVAKICQTTPYSMISI